MTEALLEVNDIQKYYGDAHVLRNINFDIQPGEFVALVGQSGGGKSTLLRLIAGLEHATSGSIKQDGTEINRLNAHSRVMFQDDRLLPWLTVSENLTFGATHSKEQKEHVAKLLARVELTDFADAYPNSLSGGQRQRVALARALMANPQLLLLDEPLGALDALTRRKMQDLIMDLWQERKMTTILVTHDVNEAVRLANRIFVVRDHQIAWAGSNDLPYPRTDQAIAPLANTILNEIITEG
ncbi:ABC transporter ATP-binding protein [Lacticaseibacillus sharpeae]|uniref:Glycine betaine ABC transporter ATP-binding component n=1 Tax=Lacticaseibacillus sharpeae JCM 1186 = DSM 20505 TaxID=1291052 RepID=A0A0R1ZIV4_9LACO|nr:ABC transporter ATP-binding protein [Lacticaseibacillus sharpeae]KRM54282.1 Glycine betaine ABC transporter ATP-binding component [Lacticaseibacillus sharpeae JCM 1186 = DSM 20505]